MQYTKAFAALAAGAMLTFGLAACTTDDPTATAEGPDSIESIGLMVQDTGNPFFAAMTTAGKDEAEKMGAKINVQDARLDLANQNDQIDAFIQQGVDLIVISAVDQDGIEPAIDRAKAAGIIVIAVDTPAKGADAVFETDAVQAGYLSCQYLIEQIGGKGEILLLDGTPIQTIIDRITGCKKAVDEAPDVTIGAIQAGTNDRDSGLRIATDMLTANPDAVGIFGMNDPEALGAALAIEQAGLNGKVIVTGVDGGPEAVDELNRDGSPFVGTATQSPGEMVRQAIQLAVKMADGEKPETFDNLIPSVLVTRDTVSEYAGW